MNLLQRLARKIISLAFSIGIPAFELFHNRVRLSQRALELARYPTGTLGREIGDCLQQNGLRPLPFFESHDLKHVLLGYGMTPVDEIRLQAFVIGNGNQSLPTMVFFIFGALLLPEEWPSFREAFRRGRKTLPISSWRVASHGMQQAAELRRMLASTERSGRRSGTGNPPPVVDAYGLCVRSVWNLPAAPPGERMTNHLLPLH